MNQLILFAHLLIAGVAVAGAADSFRPDDIIALERAALDLWSKGDPQGYLDLAAPEITYFDPYLKKRIDGVEAFKALMGSVKGTFTIARYELIDPKVQRAGDLAVLSFNLVNYDAAGNATTRWNSTEVYARRDGQWKLIHSHWSLTTPELK